MRGRNGKRACKLSAIPFRKGCQSPDVPSLRMDLLLLSFLFSCPSPVTPIVRENYESQYFTSYCARVVYFSRSLNKTANNRESQINVDWAAQRNVCLLFHEMTLCLYVHWMYTTLQADLYAWFRLFKRGLIFVSLKFIFFN